MYCVRNIKDDLYYVGASDRKISLFENIFPLEKGVSYNSYLLFDEKTVLFDTVDPSVSKVFFENIDYVLGDRKLDYVVVNHMEPDHCGTLGELILRYPNVRIITNAKAVKMIEQFFNLDTEKYCEIVKEGDIFSTGKHNLHFVMAPMVHWPEAMVTYDDTDKILFSADAFGAFGALNGNIFADEVNYDRDYIDESRRYYTNIVGKYGIPVQTLLKKASCLDIEIICPLHGHIWRENLEYLLSKYDLWSKYEPESKSVLIAYGSIYGNTENAADILANELSMRGVKDIIMYDVSKTDASYIISDAFKCSHLVFASSTYNAGIYTNMENLLLDIKAHALQNRTVAFMENGTWAPASGKLMKCIFENMKNMNIIDSTVKITSTTNSESLEQIKELANAISKDF